MFLIIKVEILSEWLGNPGKQTLRSKNPEKFMRDPPPNPARSLCLRRSFRKSVSIYSRSAPSRPSTVVSFFKCLGSCASQNNSKYNEFSMAYPVDLHFVLFSLPLMENQHGSTHLIWLIKISTQLWEGSHFWFNVRLPVSVCKDVLLGRINEAILGRLKEEQTGFHGVRGCADHIFSLCMWNKVFSMTTFNPKSVFTIRSQRHLLLTLE